MTRHNTRNEQQRFKTKTKNENIFWPWGLTYMCKFRSSGQHWVSLPTSPTTQATQVYFRFNDRSPTLKVIENQMSKPKYTLLKYKIHEPCTAQIMTAEGKWTETLRSEQNTRHLKYISLNRIFFSNKIYPIDFLHVNLILCQHRLR